MLRCRHVVRQLQAPLQRAYSSSTNSPSGNDGEDKHPIRRTLRLIANDMRKIKEFFIPKNELNNIDKDESIGTKDKFKFSGVTGPVGEFQSHCDVLVIGGGGLGSSIAYWLKKKARDGLNVVVVEKDMSFGNSSTSVSLGALSQNFSLPENIEMSLFCADFLRDAKENFGTDIPLNYTPFGQLTLSTETNAKTLMEISHLQNELGARNEILSPEQLARKFPWLNTNGVALGRLALEKEGWFDSWALLANYRRSAAALGGHFVHGEVLEFEFQRQDDIIVTASNEDAFYKIDKAVVKLTDGTIRPIKFALCIIAAGANSRNIAQMAHIGQGQGILQVPLPIEAQKRYLYEISTGDQNAPGMAMPMVVDITGTFIRRQGLSGNYICGYNAPLRDDPSSTNLDDDYFEKIRPTLINRVPSFKGAKVINSLTGFYDYNVYDDSGIVGPHPYYNNLYIASGFSGQGIQHTPAVGRAVSELILDAQFRTIDLSRFSYDRLLVNKPMYEFNALT